MKWVEDFDLFLFDFDGLLVNTEPLHYQAYLKFCENKGYKLDWSYQEYCMQAHSGPENLKRVFFDLFPDLLEQAPSWEILYNEKKRIYQELLKVNTINLMNGVTNLIDAISDMKKMSVIVTNSTKEQVDFIIAKNKTLQKINHTITRELYEKAKPSPDSYLRAIELYGKKGDRIIGFEDTLKGLNALLKAPLQPVLVCDNSHPQLNKIILDDNVLHLESLEELDRKTLV
jgi:beta-phosphoglucomutase